MLRVVVDPDELSRLAAEYRQDAADVRSLAVQLGGEIAKTSLSLLAAYGIAVGDVLGRAALAVGGPGGMLGLSASLMDDADAIDDVRQWFLLVDQVPPGLTRLLDLLPPRQPNQSLEDYAAAAAEYWARGIPLLAGNADDVGKLVDLALSNPASAVPPVYSSIKQLYQYFTQGRPIEAQRLPLWLRGVAKAFPKLGPYLDEGSELADVLLGAARTENLASLFSSAYDAARVAGADFGPALRAGAQAAGKGGGMLRFAGVAGGVVSTGISIANLASQGNPVDAYKANGAGYLADWAEAGFNASFTSMMIAPSPVTAGLTAATGIAWAGLEIYHNWDDVTAFAGKAHDAGAAAAGWAADTAGDVADNLCEATEKVGEKVGEKVDALSDSVGDAAGDLTESGADAVNRATDAVGDGARKLAGWLH